jgi:hypothetical protein
MVLDFNDDINDNNMSIDKEISKRISRIIIMQNWK